MIQSQRFSGETRSACWWGGRCPFCIESASEGHWLPFGLCPWMPKAFHCGATGHSGLVSSLRCLSGMSCCGKHGPFQGCVPMPCWAFDERAEASRVFLTSLPILSPRERRAGTGESSSRPTFWEKESKRGHVIKKGSKTLTLVWDLCLASISLPLFLSSHKASAVYWARNCFFDHLFTPREVRTGWAEKQADRGSVPSIFPFLTGPV